MSHMRHISYEDNISSQMSEPQHQQHQSRPPVMLAVVVVTNGPLYPSLVLVRTNTHVSTGQAAQSSLLLALNQQINYARIEQLTIAIFCSNQLWVS